MSAEASSLNVEVLSGARTPLADFFSILSVLMLDEWLDIDRVP